MEGYPDSSFIIVHSFQFAGTQVLKPSDNTVNKVPSVLPKRIKGELCTLVPTIQKVVDRSHRISLS